MRVGIVGLPNVGKSTVFNSLTRAGAEAQNYPFTTIDPNLGVAVGPDQSLWALADTGGSQKVAPENVDEESAPGGNDYSSEVEKLAAREGAEAVRISAKLEAEVAELPEDEAREYLEMFGAKTTGFEGFVRAAYRSLGLITFFTFNEKECRAWTLREGSTARRGGGGVHTG